MYALWIFKLPICRLQALHIRWRGPSVQVTLCVESHVATTSSKKEEANGTKYYDKGDRTESDADFDAC